MKQFRIAYETYDGTIEVKIQEGNNQQHAINKLKNCREVKECILITSENIESHLQLDDYLKI
jgi:hypothetical protein